MTTAEIVFLGVYFAVLCVLAIYGSHRYRMAFLYYRHKLQAPDAEGHAGALPRVTIQLPMFNEMYVVERLIEAVCRIDYPRDLLEIQVLDDSTDETCAIARAVRRAPPARRATTSSTSTATNRQGFKAGALEHGLQARQGRVRGGVRRGLRARARTSSSARCRSSPTPRWAWCRCAGAT